MSQKGKQFVANLFTNIAYVVLYISINVIYINNSDFECKKVNYLNYRQQNVVNITNCKKQIVS